ncbi:MAG: tryptophan-rich sensory protein [Phycisphaerae bacterium]|nr:tryptophan-rich sensory protein [Phycisphaerae bacterium]
MRLQAVVRIILMVVLCCGVGVISGFSTKNAVAGWYTTLTKPPLNPPSWIFGVVWPVLYVLMGIAAGIVWNKPLAGKILYTALGIFLCQLILNGLWTPLFFGLHRIGWALFEIIALWGSILVTLIVFYFQSKLAGILLLPYLLWVAFAIYLNAGFWLLNR